MRTGPRYDRGESATLPDREQFVEGFVVGDDITERVVDGESDPKVITFGRGEIEVISWAAVDDVNTLKRSGRTVPVVNIDAEALTVGTYVRCEYHPGVRAYVPYYLSCVPWDLEDGASYSIEFDE